jgi:hypothetical protein
MPHSGTLRLHRLIFGGGPTVHARGIRIEGEVTSPLATAIFRCRARHLPEQGAWSVGRLSWLGPVPSAYAAHENVREILKGVARCLRPVWFAAEQSPTGRGAAISAAEAAITPTQLESATVVVRFALLAVAEPPWDEMWDLIERRARFDPEFMVHGIARADAVLALQRLRHPFPSQWVRGRYAAGSPDNSPSMAQRFDPASWFPAYHLARLALGATCKHPGLNVVVALGNAIAAIRDVPGGRRLLDELAGKIGAPWQLLLADYFHARGLLQEVNPSTGSGSDTHDLRVGQTASSLDVEIKVIGGKPKRRIRDEIAARVRRLPANPGRPVVLVALMAGSVESSVARSTGEFFSEVGAECMVGAPQFSAVVCGTVFVDSGGGLPKWEFPRKLLNPDALRALKESELDAVFAPNWTTVTWPRLPFVFRYELDDPESPEV